MPDFPKHWIFVYIFDFLELKDLVIAGSVCWYVWFLNLNINSIRYTYEVAGDWDLLNKFMKSN